MCELYREQHPLLCDDVSEEERYNPQYQRRFRPITYRGRVRNQMQGAAAIIKSWPDHWSSFLVYLWVTLGMVTLTTFIVYNSLFAYTLLPTAKSRSMKPMSMNTIKTTSPSSLQLPDVYMHLVVNNNEDVDLNKFLPYIEIIRNKYVNYKYHLIIVLNDTSADTKSLSDGEHNDIALHSLWNTDISNKKQAPEHSTINVEYVCLSQYMNDSPLRKYWTSLSHQFTEFMLRAISIWEKGGIAFNPIILTPESPNSMYMEKLHNILEKYAISDTKLSKHIHAKTNNDNNKLKKSVNNIREIIDALEHEDDSTNSIQQILVEAENRNNPTGSHSGRRLRSVTEVNRDIKTHPLLNKRQNSKITPNLVVNKTKISNHVKNVDITQDSGSNSSSTAKFSLLPLFLEYLFYNKPPTKQPRHAEETTLSRKRKSITIIQMENPETNISMSTDPLIAKNQIRDDAKGVYISKNLNKTENDVDQLTIDLKGNIIATKIACHAFIGTLFGNAIPHNDEKSLTDLILTQVIIFCKGLLASCTGIDLISL